MKKNNFIFSLVIVFIFPCSSIAQKVSVKQNIMDAVKHMQLKEYLQAIELLQACYKQDSLNGNVNYLLGKSYYNSDATLLKCIPYLKKAVPVSAEYSESNPKEKMHL